MKDKKFSEEELGYRMLRMYYHKTENLYSLKPDLRLLICEKAKSSAEERGKKMNSSHVHE